MADTNTTRALEEAARERDLANACIDSLEVILFGSCEGRSRDTLEARAGALASAPDAAVCHTSPAGNADAETRHNVAGAAPKIIWAEQLSEDDLPLITGAPVVNSKLTPSNAQSLDAARLAEALRDEVIVAAKGVAYARRTYMGVANSACYYDRLYAALDALAAAAGDTSEEPPR